MSYLVHFLIFLALWEGKNIISHSKLLDSSIFQTDQICFLYWAHSVETERGVSLILHPQQGKAHGHLQAQVLS
jgi:hypothetical protein